MIKQLKQALEKRELLNDRNCEIYEGFYFSGIDTDGMAIFELFSKAKGWHYIDAFAMEPFRYVWTNKKEKAFFSYCEGDLFLVVAPTGKRYQDELEACREFYTTH